MTEERPEILVCDDNDQRAAQWAAEINLIPEVAEQFVVHHLKPGEFAKLFRALSRRKIDASPQVAPQGPVNSGDDSSPSETDEGLAQRLDRAAMVIVDFDLTPTKLSAGQDASWIDQLSGRFGDAFAYLARCFSDVPFTVLVNQDFQDSTFDVTMRRFERSFADLDVTNGDITRRSLWLGQTRGPSFRPWHWPRLVDAPAHRRAMLERLDLDRPLLEHLGLADDVVFRTFHTEQLEGLLSANEDRDAALTKTVRAVALDSDFGLHSADAGLTIDDQRLKKIAASALSHWLERVVLPAQNVLLDAPHLAARRPGVVRAEASVEQWSSLADLSDPNSARSLIDDDLHPKAAEAGRDLAPFVSRPVWLAPLLPARTPGPAVAPGLAFAEDTSRFIDSDDATEISTSVPGPHKQRFVEWLEHDEEVSDDAGSDLVEGAEKGFSIYYDPITRMFS